MDAIIRRRKLKLKLKRKRESLAPNRDTKNDDTDAFEQHHRNDLGKQKGRRFLELKSIILDRLKSVRNIIKEMEELERHAFAEENSNRIIELQNEPRQQIRQALSEWNDLDAMYRRETRKRRSRFTEEELNIQKDIVQSLSMEIERVKDMQTERHIGGQKTTSTRRLDPLRENFHHRGTLEEMLRAPTDNGG